MKLLAIDTATEACSAAVLIDGVLLARELEFERGHAEHILPMVDEVLAEAGIPLAAVDAIAFGRGPGGFTGVRLATSVAQGLAFGADRPVIPVSDLTAVAQRALDLQSDAGRVLVCNDARMQEVYWACFERHAAADAVARRTSAGEDVATSAGLATLIGTEHVSPPGNVVLPATWSNSEGDSPNAPRAPVAMVAAGRGFRAHPQLRSLIDPRSGAILQDQLLPRAHEIVRLAAVEFAAGRVFSAEEAIPVYLRDDVARPQSRN